MRPITIWGSDISPFYTFHGFIRTRDVFLVHYVCVSRALHHWLVYGAGPWKNSIFVCWFVDVYMIQLQAFEYINRVLYFISSTYTLLVGLQKIVGFMAMR